MKKFLSLVLALVMTMSLVTISAGAEDFTDAEDITYVEAVEVMKAVGVVDGDTAGNFNPANGLTRGAAAKIICNMILGPTTAAALNADTNPYVDVDKDSTFAGYIAYCQKEGIISGYADGTFKPAAPLTGYAFMKMLLGALGYDASIEGYTGANWSINVAKRAINLGLNDGLVEDFNGSDYVTREEAMLYAFNAMQADMVEYDAKTSVSIGDADVVIAGSNAEEVAQGAYKNNMNEAGLQFAEKYFSNLKKFADTDAFMRPATTWKVKSVEVGTYTATPDLTYTAGVKAGAIYSDLGTKVAAADVTVYVNGVEVAAYATDIVKGSSVKVGEYGNGVLTDLFYDADTEELIIVQELTYLGKVEKTVKATATKDAYIVLSDDNVVTGHGAPGGPLTFETDEVFEDDAIVYYTYSVNPAFDAVQSVGLAEIVTGTVTRAENKTTNQLESQNLTIDGEVYKTSYKFGGIEFGDITVKEDYNVYLDSYGYVVKAERVDDLSSEYALLKDYKDGTDWSENKALLVFADGTEKIVNTDKNYKKVGTTYHIDLTSNYKIVTWKVNADGEYALREVVASGSPATVASKDDAAFLLDTDVALIQKTTGGNVYGNSASVFVVKDNTNDSWNAYTGVKSAPTVKATATTGQQVDSYTYVKNGMVKIMFVLPETDLIVTNDSAKITFVAKASVSNLVHDAEGDYFVYNAIVDGKITTIKVDYTVGNAQNGFYSNYKFNKYDVMTSMTQKTTVSGADTVYTATGVSKTSADYTVSFALSGSAYTYTRTVADDAAIYYVDEDGVITESSYGAIVKDDNDIVYAIEKNDGMIHTLVIQEVDDDAVTTVVGTTEIVVDATNPAAVKVYAEAGVTEAEKLAAIEAVLADDEMTILSKDYDTTSGAVYTWYVKDTLGFDRTYVWTLASGDVATFILDAGETATIANGYTVKYTGTDTLVMGTNGYLYTAFKGDFSKGTNKATNCTFGAGQNFFNCVWFG